MLDFSQNGFTVQFDLADDGRLFLKNFAKNPAPYRFEKQAARCPIVEIQVCGENPNDHHGQKHTASSGSQSLKYRSHREIEYADGKELIFLLADSRMEVRVHYRFYKDVAAVRAWTEVENIADETLGLEYVSSFSYVGFDDGNADREEKTRVLIPHNAWVREVDWREYRLSELGYEHLSPSSTKRISISNTGSWSSKEFLPMGALQNLETANTLLWQIEHNGSWQWEIADSFDMMYLRLSGPTEQENHWYRALQKGERFESVKVCVALGSDLNEALAEMTRYRRKIIPTTVANGGLPVIFNDYMNCLWAKPTEENELPVIDLAAEMGAEYYCMDAGWYADGTWWETVGEWQPSAWRFPNGIQSVFDYIRKKGMVPGIWLEPEVVGISSPVAKELPDDCFFMRHGKRVIDHGRYQLDFRNPRVREYIMGVFDRVVGEYGVGYIKLDYNIEAGIGTEVSADSFGDGLLGHNRAYLAFLQSVKKKYPSLVLESCASGGMRMDYATLSVFDIQSVTDQTEYQYNAYIASAAATAVLPEQAAIWAYPKAQNSVEATIVNMVNALPLRIHLSGEIYAWSKEQIALVKEAVALYKTIRKDIARSIPFYPLGLPQYRAAWSCAGYRADSKAYLAVWRNESDDEQIDLPFPVRPQSVKVLYPAAYQGQATLSENGVLVTLRAPSSAILLEVNG